MHVSDRPGGACNGRSLPHQQGPGSLPLNSLPSWVRRGHGFGLLCLKHEETSGSSRGDVCRGERVT